MSKAQKFFICEHCGNMVGMIHNAGVPLVCCGQKMTELVANTTDAAKEKHVPVVKQEGDTVLVEVGSTSHPMGADHLIEWIYLETEQGGQRKALSPDAAPKASFVLKDDKPLAAFAYGNLHGLWKTEL